MITSLLVHGYKSLLLTEPLQSTALNVLVGANASGKSSLLQALLLLRQSASPSGEVSILRLSGMLYEAGTALDILNPAADHTLTIRTEAEGGMSDLVFRHDREKDANGTKRTIHSPSPVKLPSALASMGTNFSYLTAERVGPRLFYPLPPDGVHLSGLVGKQGEFTAAVLARGAGADPIDQWGTTSMEVFAAGPRLDALDVSAELSDSGGRTDLVANAMLGWIIPGGKFDVVENDAADSAFLRFFRDLGKTRTSVRSTHIGFGLSYALPIIAAALTLDKSGLLIVENPEAHLHPFSQSRIGAFLACVATSGRQVIIETHSDHVINGIRLAVKEKLARSEDVIITHFSKHRESSKSDVVQIRPSPTGRLDSWPPGFFDQIESDLSRL